MTVVVWYTMSVTCCHGGRLRLRRTVAGVVDAAGDSVAADSVTLEATVSGRIRVTAQEREGSEKGIVWWRGRSSQVLLHLGVIKKTPCVEE